jgi:hypothetical protein
VVLAFALCGLAFALATAAIGTIGACDARWTSDKSSTEGESRKRLHPVTVSTPFQAVQGLCSACAELVHVAAGAHCAGFVRAVTSIAQALCL